MDIRQIDYQPDNGTFLLVIGREEEEQQQQTRCCSCVEPRDVDQTHTSSLVSTASLHES